MFRVGGWKDTFVMSDKSRPLCWGSLEKYSLQLGEHNQHHIQVCPVYGRAIKAHGEVKFLFAQMVRLCGVANVVRTEVRLPVTS